MKKLFIRSADLRDFFLHNSIEVHNHETDCPVKGCGGKIMVGYGQTFSICNKCKRTILLTEKKI